MHRYETYDMWYREGSQKKMRPIEARSPEEADKLAKEFLAQPRALLSVEKRFQERREPSSTPYPEFIPVYEAN